jgi:hypothetical protein
MADTVAASFVADLDPDNFGSGPNVEDRIRILNCITFHTHYLVDLKRLS